MEVKYSNPYIPKNDIYIIKDENGKTKKIIGNKEDRLTIFAIAGLEARKEITNSDVMKSIKAISQINPSKLEKGLGNKNE